MRYSNITQHTFVQADGAAGGFAVLLQERRRPLADAAARRTLGVAVVAVFTARARGSWRRRTGSRGCAVDGRHPCTHISSAAVGVSSTALGAGSYC